MHPLEAPPDDEPALAAVRQGPRLVVSIDQRQLAASQGRHPSSHVAPGHWPTCDVCGFRTPAREETAGAVRELPRTWRRALRTDPSLLDPAARLRDELHAVTNRIERIIAIPGSHLASVSVDAPTGLAPAVSEGVLISLLQMSAGRLADLVKSLSPRAWDISGRVAGGTVTIEELVHVPLHHSHSGLARSCAGGSVVVPFERRP